MSKSPFVRMLLDEDLHPIIPILGAASLLVAAALIVTGPPSLILIGAAAAAVVLLGRFSRLGYLGAGLLVFVALPFGRGADVDQLRVFGNLPIRTHDAVVAVALLGASVQIARRGLPSAFAATTRQPTPLIVLFLGIGLGALILGFLNGHAARDVVRDVRPWLLYTGGLLALLGAASRPQVYRGLLIGAIVVSVTVTMAAVLPAFDGGLKHQGLVYDRGVLRMQFVNTVFLLPVLAYATWSAVRGRITYWPLVLFFVAVIAMSLTRSTIALSAFVLAGTAVWTAWHASRTGAARERRWEWATIARGTVLPALLSIVFGIALGTVVVSAGTPPAEATPGEGRAPTDPNRTDGDRGGGVIDRLTFRTQGLDAIGRGRFATYANAIEEISRSPAVGLGFGSLVQVDFAYSPARASTIGFSPSVDNAYLTIGMKTGLVGIALFLGLAVWPLWAVRRPEFRFIRPWFVPAWLGILALTATQAFAASGWGPFGFSLLLVLPALRHYQTE